MGKFVVGQTRKSDAALMRSVMLPGPDLNREKADLDQGMSAQRPITEIAGRRCHFRYVLILLI